MKKSHFLRNSLLGLLAVGAVAVGWGAGLGDWFQGDGAERPPGAPVRRGPLRISVVQRGNLEAKNSIELRSQIEGSTTILWLADEGTNVKAGDLVVELDTAELLEKRQSQDVTVQNARAAYTKARQEVEIQKSQNESDIATAKQAVEFAESDLNKYKEGDWPQQLQEAEEAIILAEEEKARAEDKLNWSKQLEAKGFLTRSELEADELSFRRSEILMEQAKRTKELMIRFDNPKALAELEAALREARRELARVELQAQARLADFVVGETTSEARLAIEEEKLERYVKQLDNAKMFAPEDGMVVYAREDGGRWRSDEPMAEGTTVRERQAIVTIPRPGGMVVEASVHESVIKQVRPGQSCVVTVDALTGQEFQGYVDFVAVLADKGSWWANPNQRVYRTDIAIAEGSAEMRPGMSCSVEILIDELDDTLYVPVQSVVPHLGETICFVSSGETIEQRTVKVGPSSDKWVAIEEGLDEGEYVLLSPPKGFTPQAGPEEENGEGRRWNGPEPRVDESSPQPGGAPRGPAADRRERGSGEGREGEGRRNRGGDSGGRERRGGEGGEGPGRGQAAKQPAPGEGGRGRAAQ